MALYALSEHFLINNQELIDCLIKRESGGRTDAYGDHGKAYGILQFHRATFNSFSKEYGMTYLEYENPQDQIMLADFMLSDGLSTS